MVLNRKHALRYSATVKRKVLAYVFVVGRNCAALTKTMKKPQPGQASRMEFERTRAGLAECPENRANSKYRWPVTANFIKLASKAGVSMDAVLKSWSHEPDYCEPR